MAALSPVLVNSKARWRRAKEADTMRLIFRLAVLASVTPFLAGCGVVAFPFRVTGDAAKAVPVVGKPIGEPIHAVGDAID
jgi:hypothetical protein